MNRFDRVTSLLVLLQTRSVVTAAYLSEHFAVTERTIYRDIRTLENAGVPIGSEAGVGYCNTPAGSKCSKEKVWSKNWQPCRRNCWSIGVSWSPTQRIWSAYLCLRAVRFSEVAWAPSVRTSVLAQSLLNWGWEIHAVSTRIESTHWKH